MLSPDVNVLVAAFREDAVGHERYKKWLDSLISSNEAFGVSSLVFSGFLRIVTHPAIFNPPSPIEHALDFVGKMKGQPNCVMISPGPRHWDIFVDLCQSAEARGNLVPDAYLAALAIESGSEWITIDRDYARFPGLRWRHPFN